MLIRNQDKYTLHGPHDIYVRCL